MAFPNVGMPYANQYPAAYQNYQNGSYSYNMTPQQSYSQPMQMPQHSDYGTLKWVDGEVGAKAFQLPAGLPANTPIALWDTNDCIIYLKSVNQMGMPNPLQKVHYTMEEIQQPALMSGNAAPQTDYVTKEDLQAMKNELLASMNRNGGGNK